MSSESNKITNPGLFLVAVFFFLLSLGLLGYGISKNLRTSEFLSKENLTKEKLNDKEGEDSLSKYFENALQDSSPGGTDDYYLQTDPFSSTCSQKENGKAPAVVSGTVCYR